MRKTKIICTLGPSTDDEKVVREMMLSGMNVARFNFSHQTHPEHKKRLETVVKLRQELNLPVATLLDTKGPEIRLQKLKDGKAVLKTGETFILSTQEVLGDSHKVSITYQNLQQDISIGSRILIDDGLIELRVTGFGENEIITEVVNGGTISDKKGINVPGVTLSLPFLSEQDEKDIIFGIENGFDFIAASFTRCAQDIMDIRAVLNRHGCHTIKIIAKIENHDGVNNIDEILRVTDGVMVARGDMGVEIPLEDIPVLQKMLIQKAYNAGKQVITATQMLDSMMKKPRPTRAESTDVANAIYDGTSAIMLSGETAAGLYPVEALKTMAKIAERAERDIDYIKRFHNRDVIDAPNVTNAISHATVTTAHDLGAGAIITVTKTGQTARMISKYRPNCQIIGCSTEPQVCRQMNLSWGVTPISVEEKNITDELFDHSVNRAEEEGLVQSGDLVVITAGVPLGISGTTNLLKVHVVGDVLLTGSGVTHRVACGNLCVCRNLEEAKKNFKRNDILVIPETSNEILDIMKQASGIITEVGGLNSHAAIVGLALDIPVIVEAENACLRLKSGTTVTVDAPRGIVCSDRVAVPQ